MKEQRMKRDPRTWLPLVLVTLSIILLDSMVSAQQQESIGKVTALEGKAYVLRKGTTVSEYLSLQSPIYLEDTLQTEATSKIKLTFIDGTVLNLGAGSILQITKFIYDPQQRTQTALFSIPVGVFRAVVARVSPRSKVEVATTTAVAAIRGTDWMGEATSESSAFVVLQGKVTCINNVNPNVRGEVALTDGMGTTVKVKQPPTVPNKWGEARVNALKKATELP